MSALLQCESIYDFAALLRDEQDVAALVDAMPIEEVIAAMSWDLWALPHQRLPPGDWRFWLLLAGRGSGKTHCASATVHEWARDKKSLGGGVILIAGQTYSDVREIQVEGPGGLLDTAPCGFRPRWYPGPPGKLIWPNGVRGVTATGDKPESFRGGNVAKAWGDELSWWQYAEECYDDLNMSLRKGKLPQAVFSMTPRPTEFIQRLEDEAAEDDSEIVIVNAHMLNNPNLAARTAASLMRRYAGTRLGEQELAGKVLRDVAGAMITQAVIDANRRRHAPLQMGRIVVAVDPIGSDDSKNPNLDKVKEAGIMVVGEGSGVDRGHGFLLEDLSMPGKPEEWASTAVAAYHRWGADAVIGEVNFGGDMVEAVIRGVDRTVNFRMVRASRGKRLRAEPIMAMYETTPMRDGCIHHVGNFPILEKQMTTWIPDRGMPSPDRLDALVHGLTDLLLTDSEDVGSLDAYLEMVSE